MDRLANFDVAGGTKRRGDGALEAPPKPAQRMRVLAPDVVNKIAAGEIIISPVHALKELLENSVDAGATSVKIVVKDGGLRSLQVTDNGRGIQRGDLEMLCMRHTTSKISTFEDLSSLATYGFRGEALASMSYIADVLVRTRTKDDRDHAWLAKYQGGKLVPGPGLDTIARPRAIFGEVGTQIRLEHMFRNVPARKEAIRSHAEEFRKILDMAGRYAIHCEGVGFSCTKAHEATEYVPVECDHTVVQRICSIYGKNVSKELIEISLDARQWGLRAKGYVTNSNYYSSKTTFLLFINHRCVESSTMKKALEWIYTSFLPKDGRPFIYLSLEIDPARVDVNIHPTKREVSFLNEREVIQAICNEIKSELAALDGSRIFMAQNPLSKAKPIKPLDKDAGNAAPKSTTPAVRKVRRNSNELVRTDNSQGKITSMLRLSSLDGNKSLMSLVNQEEPLFNPAGKGNSSTGPVGKGTSSAGLVDKGNSSTGPVGKGTSFANLIAKEISSAGLIGKRKSSAGPIGKRISFTGLVDKGISFTGLAGKGISSAGLAGKGISSAGLAGKGISSAGLFSKGISSAGLAGKGISSAGLFNKGISSAGPIGKGISSAGPIGKGISSAGLVGKGISSAVPVGKGISSAGAVGKGISSAGPAGKGISSARALEGEPYAVPQDTTYTTRTHQSAQINYTSIRELRKEVDDDINEELTNIMASYTFVGLLDETQRIVAIQAGVKLYLIDYGRLCCEFFYQRGLEDFGNFGVIKLVPPPDLTEIIEGGIQTLMEGIDFHHTTRFFGFCTERVKGALVRQREMLKEYFNVEITPDGKLVSIPLFIKDYSPTVRKLGEFLCHLGRVEWSEEKVCFRMVLKQLAMLYIPEPLPTSPTGEWVKPFSWSDGSTITSGDRSTPFDPETCDDDDDIWDFSDFPPSSDANDETHEEAQSGDGGQVMTDKEFCRRTRIRRQNVRYALESIIFPAFKKQLTATNQLMEKSVKEVADLKDVYKEFQRC